MGEYNDVTLLHLKRRELKNKVKMVRETTCGLSFQLKKGGIDDGIEHGFQTKSFYIKYVKWESTFSNGKLQFVDGRLWQNYGSMNKN
jgi:hypothetical protein